MVHSIFFALCGLAFGLVLSRSGAADYDFIQKMFLFRHIQLYGILAVAVGTTALGLAVLKRVGRDAADRPLKLSAKPTHAGNLWGGALFGAGWALTGMCPGPILVNIGEGKVYALAALAGALVGTSLLGAVYDKLAPRLGLPPT